MSGRIPTLLEAFSLVRDFRRPQGKRYPLSAVLLLTWLAMLQGIRSEQEIAEWGGREGKAWLPILGVRRRRGPSYATIHRILQGIDRRQLEAALGDWMRQVLEAGGAEPAGGTRPVMAGVTGETAAPDSLDLLAQSLSLLISRFPAEKSWWEGVAVNGLPTPGGADLEARESDLSHPCEAGLKIWGLDWETIEEERSVSLPARAAA